MSVIGFVPGVPRRRKLVDGDSVFFKRLNNFVRAERGGLDQRTVDFLRFRRERTA